MALNLPLPIFLHLTVTGTHSDITRESHSRLAHCLNEESALLTSYVNIGIDLGDSNSQSVLSEALLELQVLHRRLLVEL